MTNVADETQKGQRAISANAPGVDGATVVAGNGTIGPFRALWIANTGTVSLRTINGTPLTFANVPGGSFLSMMGDQVTACPAGTVAVW